MFCPKCGAGISNGERFCPKCGASVGSPSPASTQQNQWQPQSNQWQSQSSQQPMMPMNWYKFLIYFALFAGAVLNLITAIRYLTGSIYGSNNESDMLYSVIPSWQTLDMMMGVLLLGMAAFGVYTRFRLAGYYRNGPMCLYLVYGLAAGINLIYLVSVASLVSDFGLSLEDLEPSSTIVSIITSLVMIGINYVYFKKRAALFNK